RPERPGFRRECAGRSSGCHSEPLAVIPSTFASLSAGSAPALGMTSSADQLRGAGEGPLSQINVVLRPHVQRHALVQLRGLDVENAMRAVDGGAARLLSH